MPMDVQSVNPPNISSEFSEERLEQLQAQVHSLERRDWWLWSMAVVVMLLLTLAVVSMTFPGLIETGDPVFQYSLDRAVRGLVGLVLIFNAYTIYQQVTVKRLRRQFSQQIDALRDLRIRAEEFQRLATTDPLTGLSNRRTGEDRLAAEVARSNRYGHPLTLVAFDLNKFKETNDRYGHAAGDAVLQAFAQKLRSTLRASDLAIRIGGDEFLALLPECKTDHASNLLARLRPLVAEYQGMRIPVEFAVGIAGYEQGDTLEKFMKRADQILYANKRAGRSETFAPSLTK
jgi:diguanylate cyclase (GGDEF)-like protein